MAKKIQDIDDINSFSTEADYLDWLIDQCVTAYGTLLSDVLSLDFVGVQGKYRSLVLSSPKYKKSTQMISAQNHFEAHKEVTKLINELKRTQESVSTSYDVRNTASLDTKDFKDYITLHSKLLDMKQDLYEQGNKKTSETELEALNVFFIPVTQQEFEKLQNVEIYEGDASGNVGFCDKEAELTPALDAFLSTPHITTLPDGTEVEVVD